jgi:hypothetical protein
MQPRVKTHRERTRVCARGQRWAMASQYAQVCGIILHEGLLAFILLLTIPTPGDHAQVAVYKGASCPVFLSVFSSVRVPDS